ncbi:hypothetical protein LXL04_024806 [Taraxacum kok-saghyz]
MDVEMRRSFDAVVLTTFWVICTFRNNLLFGLGYNENDIYCVVVGTNLMSVALMRGTWSSSSKFLIQLVSAVALATPLYSASALERETVGWRLEDHETRLSPRKTQ